MPHAFASGVLHITTGTTETVTDLTAECEHFLTRNVASGDGPISIFVPHATAGIAILETGSGSDEDLLTTRHTLLPADAAGNTARATPATYSPPSSRRTRRFR